MTQLKALSSFFFYSILKQHALIKSANCEITIGPASMGAKIKVNGMPLTGERVLKHFDRILFGKLSFVKAK